MINEGISPETNLQALFSRWPATISVFLRYRMSCVGCSMSAFDTLGEATANYHLEWPAFLAELWAAIESGQEADPPDPI
jgi:hybrid cluster-associated redox disulfide protein